MNPPLPSILWVTLFLHIYLFLYLFIFFPFIISASERTPAQTDPCFPTPCGVNADCVNNKGVASCVCLSGFYGNPHSGCHRECESNTDCASSLVCSNYKCVDPCPETCGIEAVCTVSEHKPVCACAQGFSGDPFIQCHPIPVSRKLNILNFIFLK